MARGLVAEASAIIGAPRLVVWDALVDPQVIKRYMFGTEVISGWKQGGPIVWKGEWEGRRYEDKGVILELEPGQRVRYSHFSPLSGLADAPENYHIVTVELADDAAGTRISLSQDNNRTEEGRRHSEENWRQVLAALKHVLEGV
jgi:uncharacterized protein YndB with AHSA1/START domain